MTLHESEVRKQMRRDLVTLIIWCSIILGVAILATTGPADWHVG